VPVHELVGRDRCLHDVILRHDLSTTESSEEVTAEQRLGLFLEQHPGLPRTGNVGSVEPAHACATEVEELTVRQCPGRA
jgi:hypothetical protein